MTMLATVHGEQHLIGRNTPSLFAAFDASNVYHTVTVMYPLPFRL